MRGQQIQARHHQIASQQRSVAAGLPHQRRHQRQMLGLDQGDLPCAARYLTSGSLRVMVAFETARGDRHRAFGRTYFAASLRAQEDCLDPARKRKAGHKVAQVGFVQQFLRLIRFMSIRIRPSFSSGRLVAARRRHNRP
jgi:hypothetical protein